MKITIGSTPLGHDYCDVIVVNISGYFGDGDSYFSDHETFRLDDENLPAYLCMCDQLGNRFEVETIKEMKEYLIDKGYNPDKVDIPVDPWSYEMLPCGIDTLDVHYYNDKGQKFSVEYEV